MVGNKLLELRKHVGNHHLKNMRFRGLPAGEICTPWLISAVCWGHWELPTTSPKKLRVKSLDPSAVSTEKAMPHGSWHIPSFESGNQNWAPRFCDGINFCHGINARRAYLACLARMVKALVPSDGGYDHKTAW